MYNDNCNVIEKDNLGDTKCQGPNLVEKEIK